VWVEAEKWVSLNLAVVAEAGALNFVMQAISSWSPQVAAEEES
jgi:hypothetical protein